MKYRYFLLVLLFTLISVISKGQKLWTLDACIEYARNNNINIKQQELSLKSNESDLLKSYASLLPNLNGVATHNYNYGKTVDRYTNNFAQNTVQSDNFYLSSNITLFSGFQLLNTIKKNKLETSAGKYDLDKMINDISLNIATAYLQILYNIELLGISESQLSITQQQVDRTKKLLDAGTIAKGNLLTIEAQSAADELQVITAKNSLDMSYLALKQMLDLPVEEAFDIVKPEITISGAEIIKESPAAIYSFALSNQPEVKSAELKVKSSDISLNIAKGSLSPILSLGGSIGTGYSGASQPSGKYKTDTVLIGYTSEINPVPVMSLTQIPEYLKIPFNTQINDNINKSVGFNLTIPLFNGLQSQNMISKSKIALKSAEYNLELTKNRLNKDIQQAYSDAKAAFNKYNATQRSMAAFNESYRYAEGKYNAGSLNFVDFSDAKTKLMKAKSELLQAKYDYTFRIKILEFYQGKTLSFK